MSSLLGLVVVGVGMAGRVRIRDIVNQATLANPFLRNVQLVGFVSRRELTVEDAQQIPWKDAMSRPDVHAVIICTENERHESLAREALEAGKHVLVEFPLALTPHGATSLIDLAKQKGVLCYEEDISLITETHKKALEIVKEKGLKSIHKTLKGCPNGWIENIERSGSPFITGISMMHRVLELCGDVTPVSATLQVLPQAWSATAKLTGRNNEEVMIEYERNASIRGRQTSLSYTLGDGTVVNDQSLRDVLPPSDPNITKPGLFLQDTINFVSMIRGELDVTASNVLTVRALQVAADLYKLSTDNTKSEL